MPAASSALLSNLEKGLFFAVGEGSRIFVACCLHSSAQMCLYQTPGRRPPPITGRFVNTVTRGWVGAPNERAPFRFHGAVVGFVDRCLSRTRNLAASNKHLVEFSQADLGPRSAQELFFSGFLKSLELFFRRFVLIASGTEIFWRLSLKFYLFMEASRFHCPPVLPGTFFVLLFFFFRSSFCADIVFYRAGSRQDHD